PLASSVTDDGARFDAARAQLIQRYLELKGAPVPAAVSDPTSVVSGDRAGEAGGCTAAPAGPMAAASLLGLLTLRAARRARRGRPSR
ncbi:MAG: hypothetical protein FJ086_07920, partial [Deltaproteobacteria bacterium]|nr:hypothetical protein [Deltaproteobacteria bacterium]